MVVDDNRIFTAIGMLQSQVTTLAENLEESRRESTEEHRKVHDIIDALSEAVRNLVRVVEEMKPHVDSYRMKAAALDRAMELTEDYRDEKSEKRGEDRYKSWLYGMVASAGGLVVFVLGKLWDLISARPHP